MKRAGLVFSTLILFAISLYAAYVQGSFYATMEEVSGTHLAPAEGAIQTLSGFGASFAGIFANIINALSSPFGGNVFVAIILLALIVELITLYPSVNIQLKQKKIHLFHKKLVDRFNSGELSYSKSQHELNVLYSVNERIHTRGAWLVVFQLVLFVLVLWGLSLAVKDPSLLTGTFSSFNFALMNKPVEIYLPLLAGLAYMLHSLIKIHLKQKEDYISPKQIAWALSFALVSSALVFYFSTVFPVLISAYFVTLITFSTMRYLIVEENQKAWGKYTQKELIKMLRTSRLHKTKFEKLSRKFNHLPIVRHINLHLLEEAASMSLALFLFMSSM